ncbi:MAG: hypothetical protein CSA09_02690 [Candidatus Contendobacter odensis]|uniref:Uncharacterized protein n=1 Tax=Candidatus Contendibacter odensensis TaxID=1400860 RepID=A0A2G6PF69_9GAMM|nr:MAG: hypothetical protein CSA09_02690 [Candidatus Contendobacter odensis]
MSTWQISGVIVLIAIIGIVATMIWLMVNHSRGRKKQLKERLIATRQAAARQRVADKRAAAHKMSQERLAAKRAAVERQAAKRAEIAKAAAERVAAERAAVEREIAEWAIAEQAENERVRAQRQVEKQREAEEVDIRMRAVEEAIAEWVEVGQYGSSTEQPVKLNVLPEKTRSHAEAIQQQVQLTAKEVAKERDELEFIKNRIEADVDFLPVEFKHTINEWKVGKVFRRSTFDDLKLKFRYKAYSVEDGYELLQMYRGWVAEQREKLAGFAQSLGGGTVDKSQTIQAIIERAEQNEREKQLEMDVDVIYALRNIRDILERLINMEILLKALDEVCRKRSEQIIAPPWQEKGTL